MMRAHFVYLFLIAVEVKNARFSSHYKLLLFKSENLNVRREHKIQ